MVEKFDKFVVTVTFFSILASDNVNLGNDATEASDDLIAEPQHENNQS